VEGNFDVKILDDGTPEKYLEKIQEKYPKIEIFKSENYLKKTKSIEENLKSGKEIDGFEIPTKLWTNAAKNASEYFIMTEDDVWFTGKINLDFLEKKMREYDMALIKLGWISNRNINAEQILIPETDIISLKPKIFTAPRKIMNYFFDNQFKFFSFLYKLKLVDNNTKNDYWIMNSLLMGIYNKRYWLKVWEKIDGKVDEKLQIKNAVQWFRKHRKNPHNFNKLETLKMNTTFISSATNSYHQYQTDCDINVFNHIMSEEWYRGNLDALENFPKDFSEDYFVNFLDQRNHPKCFSEVWKKWAENFKEQYRKQDVTVD
jgi:hypothetical protein